MKNEKHHHCFCECETKYFATKLIATLDINLIFPAESEKLSFSNQQSFELNPLPPPPLTDDNDEIVVNVTIPLNNDTDFINYQLGELMGFDKEKVCVQCSNKQNCICVPFHPNKNVNNTEIEIISDITVKKQILTIYVSHL